MNREKEIAAFVRLLDVMDELREKCPWDREQTMESLRPLTIEETYELSEAILMNDNKNISKELGDILLHIVFYAKIGKEQKNFDISDVMNLLCDKLIYRHPHVFGEKEVSGSQEVISNWENLKTKEKDGNKTILSGVPESLPSVVKAYRMQDKARAVGFDWDVKEDVWNKVKEELTEFESELRSTSDNNLERAEKEFGDLMISLINAARLYKINPDSALEMTNMKFRKRFDFLEQRVKSQGRSLKEMTVSEMDVIWEEAKKVVG